MWQLLARATLVVLVLPAQGAEFSQGLEASWQFAEANGVCRLEQRVGDYGVARFTGLSGKPLRFEVVGHRDLFAPGAVTVAQVAPPWHRDHPARVPLGSARHLTGGGVSAADPTATRVLMALYQGYDAELASRSWYGDGAAAVAVRVSSVSLRPLYQRFVHCFESVLSLAWADVERTRVTFPVAGWQLDDAGRERLTTVADYVLADPTVSGVFVDGHTDATGAARGNVLLSKRRAEAVRNFLTSSGVPEKLLTVRYHGARYPVADNETPAGRAANRRATVRLERNWGQAPEVAAHAPAPQHGR